MCKTALARGCAERWLPKLEEKHDRFRDARPRKRVTSNKPNVFFQQATCDDCGHTTDPRITGCNYVVMIAARR
jgi:hypothetical protein